MQRNADDSNDPNAICFDDSKIDSKEFLKQALLEKKNVIPYYDVPFKGSRLWGFSAMSSDYKNEDIAKPPVFETFISTKKRSPRFPLLGFQHAYLGLRYTELREKGGSGELEYARRRLRIGFGGGEKVGIFTLESGADNLYCDSTVASQTSIPITKVPQLFSNIVSYFNTYNYSLLSRNCNIFVKNMAKSIGLDHIAKIYSSISPAISANRMVSTMVKNAKNGEFGEFYSEFDSWKDCLLRRYPISDMNDRGPRSNPVTIARPNPNFPNLPYQYKLQPKLALNRNMFLNEVLTEMCRDVGILKENQEFLTRNAIELEAYRPITNPFSIRAMAPEKLQKNINARTDERYHYYKLKGIEDMIINSASTNYRRKQIQDVIRKINRVANQLDLVDILLRYKSNEYYNQVFKGNAQHISDIDKIQISIRLAMKACGRKYINAFLYLSKVNDMLEKAKFQYLYEEEYELGENVNRYP